MSEEQTPVPTEQVEPTPQGAAAPTTPATESWQEVGRQFQELGKSLATAVRSSWYDEENRKRLQAMQAGLEAMVHEVSQAVRERAVAPAGQKARAGVERASQEVRPRVVQTLRQLNSELERIIGRMDVPGQPGTPAAAPEAPVAGTPAMPTELPPESAAPPTPDVLDDGDTGGGEKKWYQEQ